MKFTKYTFLMLGLASLFSVSGIDAAFATACNKKNVAAGKFCHAGGAESDCRPGCYCLGANKEEGVNNSQVDKACEGKWSSPKSELNRVGVQYCPDDFPNSASGAKKATECYYINSSGKKIYYQQHTCSAGYFLPKDSDTCKACGDVYTVSSGKYCPGVSDIYPSKTSDQGIQTCPSGQTPNSTLKSCTSSGSSNNSTVHCYPGEYMPENSTECQPCNFFMYCPGGDYKKSSSYPDGADRYCHIVEVDSNDIFEYKGLTPAIVSGGNTEDDLVIPTLNGGPCEKMKDVTVKCEKGYYLNKMRRFCDKCRSDTVCKGGTFHLSLYEDQGLGETCTEPAHPNNDTGKCVRNTVYCAEGTYLPANKTSSNDCKACPSGKLCPGGYFETGWDKNQGILDKNSITVNPGYYLPKASTESKKCTSTSKYCPGGTFEPSASRDQGQFDCPTGSRATDDKSACAVTLTKKQMMYGINGTGGRYSENAVQCWTKTGADYKACMGFKSDGSWTSTSRSWTFNKSETYYNLASPLVQAASESPRK